MIEFRDNVALAVDGGGIRGTMVAKALAVVEEEVGVACHDIFGLTAGTSTGSIISVGIAAGIRAERIHELYVELGDDVFKKSWRTLPFVNLIARYKYSNKPLIEALRNEVGEVTMGEFWNRPNKVDVVITVRDLTSNSTRFVKSWKGGYKDWKAWFAVVCSSTVPTYFPVVSKSTVPMYFPDVEGEFVDGGVGSYSNPCYIAAYEIAFCLKDWNAENTTLISIGTGRDPNPLREGNAGRFFPVQWIKPLLETFVSDASDQQVRLVHDLFPKIDFRRFQMDLEEPIPMDDPKSIPKLTKLGEELGRKILNDEVDEKVLRKAGVAS